MTKQRNKLTIRGLLFTLVILMGALGRVPLTASAAADLAVQITRADGNTATVTLKANDEGYYEIGTADELYAFAAAVNGGDNAINGKLIADIEVNKNVLASDGSLNGDGSNFRVWTPIGPAGNGFTGTFDGAGHTISGLYFNDSNTNYVGLFGHVGTDGRVQKVGVTDFYFGGSIEVGGIAGSNNGTITNCYTTGTVNGTRDVGGVVGYNANTVASCYNAGTTSSMWGKYVGGIVGYNGSSNSKVQSSFFVNFTDNYGKVGIAVGVDSSGETLGTVDNVDGKDTKAFASGEVAYLLNGDQTELVFKQTLGTDAAPKFTGATVYKAYIGCAGGTVYSNDEALKDINVEHLYNNLICAFCGEYESAIQNADGYYEIDNAGKLFWFAEKVNEGDTGINGKLTADIVVNESVLADGSLNGDVSNFLAWKPIGTSNAGFTGTFDGAGHTISGLYFNDINTSYVGLFGVVGTGGTIEKVGVTDSYFYGNRYVGGIAGQNGGTIRNCYNSGAIKGWGNGSISDYYYIGGVVGKNTSKVENCYNVGSVVSYGIASYAGGLVGSGTVINSYSIEGAYSSNNTGGGGGGGGGGGSDDAEDDTDSKTAEQFASGEVAYLLNGDQTELVFKQTLGTDTAPNFTGEPVYYLKKCSSDDEVYSNVNEVHNFVGDTCEDCGVGKTIVITMQANNEIGSWNGAAITIKGNGEVISENNTVDMYEGSRTVEFTCIPCKTYSFYWKSGYDENCSFTISSGTKELFSCADAESLVLNDDNSFFEYTLLGTHDFPAESRTCQYCNETCGVDFDHAEENGTCSICQATLCEVTAQLTNITSDGTAWAVVNEEYVARLTAEDGFELPETITVTIGGEAFTAYTFREGVLTIPAESVTGEITIAAEALVLAQYAIAINSTENGTVTADAETAAKGTTVTLSITPATGYYLTSLTVVDENEVEVPVENNAFVMPEASVTVTAVFAKDYGDFVIEGESDGWNVTDDVLTFTQGGAYTVSLADGKTETSQVIVVDAEGVTLTLNQVTIKAPNGTYGDSWEGTVGTPGVCALTLNHDTALVLTGENTLIGGNGGSHVGMMSSTGYAGGAGISASTYMVTLSGEGSLTARGGDGEDSSGSSAGNGGAGIDGSVTLYGGTVTVLGGTAGQDDSGSGNGETGAGLTGTITVADGKMLKITAGASEASAEETTVYGKEQYAEFAVECTHTDTKDGLCVACGKIMDNISGVDSNSLNLKDNVEINYYMKLSSETISDETAYLQVTLPGGATEQIMLNTVSAEEDGSYKFTFDVDAAEMADEFMVQVVSDNGGKVGNSFTYSVRNYADTILSDDNYAPVQNVVKSMLNYGAYAQKYFNYNESDLANAGLDLTLEDVLSEDLVGYEKITNGSLPDGMEYTGSSLLLESNVVIRHYFTIDREKVTELPTVTGSWSNWGQKDGQYYLEQSVVAAKLDNALDLKIGDWQMSYSALSYVKAVLENSSAYPQKLIDLLKALYHYSQEASAYFNE